MAEVADRATSAIQRDASVVYAGRVMVPVVAGLPGGFGIVLERASASNLVVSASLWRVVGG